MRKSDLASSPMRTLYLATLFQLGDEVFVRAHSLLPPLAKELQVARVLPKEAHEPFVREVGDGLARERGLDLHRFDDFRIQVNGRPLLSCSRHGLKVSTKTSRRHYGHHEVRR